MARTTYVYCKKAKKMVLKGTEHDEHNDRPGGPMVIGPLEPFISPVTGEEITSRAQLARHNRANGITNSQDYSPEWYQRKEQERRNVLSGNTEAAKRERVEALHAAIHKHRR